LTWVAYQPSIFQVEKPADIGDFGGERPVSQADLLLDAGDQTAVPVQQGSRRDQATAAQRDRHNRARADKTARSRKLAVEPELRRPAARNLYYSVGFEILNRAGTALAYWHGYDQPSELPAEYLLPV
jgi:hypothetical protein